MEEARYMVKYLLRNLTNPKEDARMPEKITPTKPLSHTTAITLTAMFIVLTYIFTLIGVNITVGLGGYLHLGNIPLLVAAIFFGKKIGAVSAGVGMALFDILSPYAIWAPYTLIIGLATGFVVGLITEKRKTTPWIIVAVIAAIVVKVVGYYFAEVMIYGNWIAPFISIPANVLQVVIAAVVVLAILKPLRTAVEKIKR